MKIPEQCVKSVQSYWRNLFKVIDVLLASLLLSLSRFHLLIMRFHCCLWTSKLTAGIILVSLWLSFTWNLLNGICISLSIVDTGKWKYIYSDQNFNAGQWMNSKLKFKLATSLSCLHRAVSLSKLHNCVDYNLLYIISVFHWQLWANCPCYFIVFI